jgi:outer membrane protein OmpA-like peptidoglycan-associated protein
MMGWGSSGGPKYREHFHDFKAAVFGYAAAGAMMAVIIHAVVFSSSVGNLTLKHVMAQLGISNSMRETVTLCGGKAISLDPNTFNYKVARFLSGSVSVNGEQRFTFDKLNFATDSATIAPESNASLQELGQVLGACATTRVRIAGYTDSTGDAAHNKTLSEQRAAAVKAALVGFGIDAARLDAAGFGPANPVASNDTEDGRAQNRRTELVILNH